MSKKIEYRKMLFCLMVSALAANCGGGGGGGSTPNQVKNQSIPSVKKDPIYKIALLDGDFITNQKGLKETYPNISFVQLDEIKPTRSKHAQKVLKVLTEEGKDDFNILAITIGGIVEKEVEDKDGKKGLVSLLKPKDEYYDKAFKDFFKDQKIKIVNQSWGLPLTSLITSDETGETQLYLDYDYRKHDKNKETEAVYLERRERAEKQVKKTINMYKEKINEGGLFVWANGNRIKFLSGIEFILGFGSLQAQLPNCDKDLEKGWIAVVGINPDGKKHYEKHLAYANGTKNWAISASGTGPDGKEIGSSFATPRVTRAAAYLAHKFDWMTNSQIRQTLFTTTDKPETKEEKRNIVLEPTIEYGWGVLNEKRALKGPGAFIKRLLATEGTDSFRANLPKGRTSTFENDIHGDGGLTKLGGGKLILGGENTYTGDTTIEEGVLAISRNNSSKKVLVKENGSLEIGKGVRLESNLNNEGKIYLEGETSVKGDYITSKNSITNFAKGASLEIEGKTRLEGHSIKIDTSEYVSGNSKKKELIRYGKIEGELPEIVGNEGLKKARLTKDGNTINVEIGRENVSKHMASDPKVSASNLIVGDNLETVLVEMDAKIEEGKIDARTLEIYNRIEELSASKLNESAEKMSGEIYASAQNLTFRQASSVNRNLSNHLGDLKSFGNTSYEWQGWSSGILSAGDIKKSGYASAKTRLEGGQIGLDRKIDPKTLVGVGIDYSYAKADFDRYAGRFDSDGVGISLYGKRYLDRDYYMVGRVGIGKYSTRVSRGILDENLDTVDNGNIRHEDRMISAYVEAGKHYRYLTPFVGYSYDELRRGEFGENEGSLGIVAKAKNYTRTAISMGVRGEYEGDGYRVNSHITHEINVGDRKLDFDGRFATSDTKVVFKGVDLIKNSTWVGVGVTKDVSKSISVGLNYDIQFANSKKSESLVGVNLGYRF